MKDETKPPLPRAPTLEGPTHIPYEKAVRRVWGDVESGEVEDWVYVSTEKIYQVVFGLPPGGAFRHSESWRTIFAADEVLWVLSGTLVLSNPQTGEVHLVRAGEGVFFRRDTWHHGFSYGSEPLRVLEFFAPPPALGTTQGYARTKPNLTKAKYSQDQWMGRWPMSRAEAESGLTMRVLREEGILWRMEGQDAPVLVGILASTDYLTVGRVHVLPGQVTDIQLHGGDESLYVLEGDLNIRLPQAEGNKWFELKPGDGFFIPEATPHQYHNPSNRPAALIFGVGPRYLPD